MDITDPAIDGGRAFDFGRTSADYARFRDIYPAELYNTLAGHGIGISGQNVLDLGTGTAVLPRNMQGFGAKWTGLDISAEQLAQAKRLAAGQGADITLICSPAETVDLAPHSFDAVTACQCFWYFDPVTLTPRLAELLKPHGKLAVVQMSWLPREDSIAAECERLILRFNPHWTGAGWTRTPVDIPAPVTERFAVKERFGFDVTIPFTRESWHGRLRACRGTAASLSEKDLAEWDREDKALLERIASERFGVLHYAAGCILELK